MDIKTEREAFEAWYCRNHTGLKQSDLAKFRTLSGYSFSDSLKINVSWEAWQAKAQAVTEGFVLVSAEQMSQWGHMANCAEEYGCPECYEARGYAHILACEINAYFNVSEAQEQK